MLTIYDVFWAGIVSATLMALWAVRRDYTAAMVLEFVIVAVFGVLLGAACALI